VAAVLAIPHKQLLTMQVATVVQVIAVLPIGHKGNKMSEQHYVFLKNNVVEQIAVFASKDEELADAVAIEHGYDDAVWVGENTPVVFSSYNGKTFTEPTLDYLYERGISNENTAMQEARVAAMEAAKATETVE
jgi:hypothetical protein